MTHDPLISTALLGTARMSAMPPPPHPSLEKTWQAIDRENPAAAVLQALALSRTLRMAGAGTVLNSGETSISPPEKHQPLPAAGVDLAMRLLSGEFPEILPEWMGLATATNRTLPPRVLPELLAMAAKNRAHRPSAIILAGERGQWIARRHEEFSWLLEASQVGEDAWETGTPPERLAWLCQTRATDPATAAETISSHWPDEDAPFREAILHLVSESPQPCDESWLESLALADRRQDIRELATISLVKIPGTAFHTRATSRIRDHVKIQRRLMKRTIAIEPPAAFDPAWAADGIREKPPRGIGEKAWWLRQLVSLIPLDQWPGLLDIPQDDLFSLPREKDWQEPLLAGWMESAIRFPHRSLAGKFVPFVSTLDPCPAGSPTQPQVIQGILGKLPATAQFTILDKLAKTLAPPFALDLLARTGSHPPEGHGKAILSILDEAISRRTTFLTRPQARSLAICIPPTQIQSRLERLAKLPALSSPAEEFATTLEFRRTMLSHFSDPEH